MIYFISDVNVSIRLLDLLKIIHASKDIADNASRKLKHITYYIQ
jgi:hypothetical protein